MTTEAKSHSAVKIGSNRNFGLVFAAVFAIVALWPLTGDNDIRYWAAASALVFLIIALIRPDILQPLNLLWFKFGLLLGRFVSPIVMGIIFFVAVVPTGLLMRLMKKDPLLLKIDPDKNSYWIDRGEQTGSMKDQF